MRGERLRQQKQTISWTGGYFTAVTLGRGILSIVTELTVLSGTTHNDEFDGQVRTVSPHQLLEQLLGCDGRRRS
jgi:hypothetical protein